MTNTPFLDRAERLLQAVEANCDRINDTTDADIDAERTGGMVTLTFANRSQIVINLQPPLHEIWLAAQCGGFHYQFQDAQWQDTRGRGEFFASLSDCASQQSGCALTFADDICSSI